MNASRQLRGLCRKVLVVLAVGAVSTSCGGDADSNATRSDVLASAHDPAASSEDSEALGSAVVPAATEGEEGPIDLPTPEGAPSSPGFPEGPMCPPFALGERLSIRLSSTEQLPSALTLELEGDFEVEETITVSCPVLAGPLRQDQEGDPICDDLSAERLIIGIDVSADRIQILSILPFSGVRLVLRDSESDYVSTEIEPDYQPADATVPQDCYSPGVAQAAVTVDATDMD